MRSLTGYLSRKAGKEEQPPRYDQTNMTKQNAEVGVKLQAAHKT